jgi:hypothetical protein
MEVGFLVRLSNKVDIQIKPHSKEGIRTKLCKTALNQVIHNRGNYSRAISPQIPTIQTS